MQALLLSFQRPVQCRAYPGGNGHPQHHTQGGCHALRHSCASLLLKEGVPMKQIQEWLGHRDISTTANIYAHLDSQSKNLSARTMDNTLTLLEAQPIKKW